MLNQIAAAGTGADGFRWIPTSAFSAQKSMFRWTRRHDTLEPGPAGPMRTAGGTP